ncbi:MAG: hypothetical protein HC880_11945 [Bacteroidia bacterium]|nr:hypothetical protein [Bacteroidia bacterium]
MLNITPRMGASFQYRPESGANTIFKAIPAEAPQWLRLVREGNRFSAYFADNRGNWKLLDQVDLRMPRQLWIGMAVTSHDNRVRTQGVFEHLSVRSLSSQTQGLPPIARGGQDDQNNRDWDKSKGRGKAKGRDKDGDDDDDDRNQGRAKPRAGIKMTTTMMINSVKAAEC